MAAAFVLGEDVDFSLGLGVGSDRTGLCENLTALDLVLFDTTEEQANVVARLTLVEELAEHFNARYGRLERFAHTDDFDFVANLDNAAFDTAGSNCTTTGDREHVFDAHHERLVDRTLGFGNFGVDSVHELVDGLYAEFGAFECAESRAVNDLDFVALVVVLVKQVANFHFNEFEQFLVVDEVALVEEHYDLRYADLTCEQNVFAGLGHRAVCSGNYEDCAVHLGSTRNHILNEVRVAGAVNVRVVASGSFVFDVSDCDCNRLGCVANSAALSNVLIGLKLSQALVRLNLQDCGRESSLTVVDVTDGADVYVWFRSDE